MIAAPPLYILRHGETEWNATGRLQGSCDAPLTPLGREQARAQHAILSARDLTGFAAFSSPQCRAFRTAAIALNGLVPEITTVDALREIGLGSWAGKERAALMAAHGAQDGFDLYELAPGGEGLAALRTRCASFLETLRQPSILVTHGITSRMLRLLLTGRDPAAIREMEGGQGVVFSLENGQQTRLTPRA